MVERDMVGAELPSGSSRICGLSRTTCRFS
jgi:hypothetical protein